MRKKIWWAFLLLLVTVTVILTGVIVRNHRHLENETQIPRMTQSNQKHITIKQRNRFINKISTSAVINFEKNRVVLPSVVIAQAILESQYGTSELYKLAKNPFGIKGSYQGQSMTFYTHEVEKGKTISVLARFRKYPNLQAAIMDHNQLVHRKFVRQKNVLSYRKTTRLLQKNGYATDPHYAQKLNHLIVKYKLGRYDLKALNDN
ncbi:glycoside hydrolase family 73 protein [Lentilactobacillus hilgardii]|uniref:glycoside hydrolase family 73 protein n=1 Tax=Lentilactobacillus hilgardii TaxID=1588 RepID=UPI0021C34804|nr:glucosaminidase domain-containing protein [Lentilactobacillus hilgardii]MCP9334204.1 glucosaminidase domain-containing protein [Lentilactobacillus hilgardii]MCP9350803.1 glucosaminidase domain-containing protein [Lentilactobacillus hilgardii]MCP9353702.1 glucosaminidase domain-containing protein [Lentilactobacillus hilgardii]